MRFWNVLGIMVALALAAGCQQTDATKGQEPQAKQETPAKPAEQKPAEAQPQPAADKPAEAKAEQPNAEEPKAEEPKAEQPKAEEPKAEQPAAQADPAASADQANYADEVAKRLTAVEIPSFEYPAFSGKKIALIHTVNLVGELKPCG